MVFSQRFFRWAAVACGLTALSTLGIHLLPNLYQAPTFEQQLELRNNTVYLVRLWIVLLHCMLVAVAMLAAGVKLARRSAGLAAVGFLGYCLFSLCEMLRTSMVIFALNQNWRERYATATDETARVLLRANIEGVLGWGEAFFFLFSLGIFLGTLAYGLALARGTTVLDRALSLMLLLWAALLLLGLLRTALNVSLYEQWFGWVGPVYQPILRLVFAIWLWRQTEERFEVGPQAKSAAA